MPPRRSTPRRPARPAGKPPTHRPDKTTGKPQPDSHGNRSLPDTFEIVIDDMAHGGSGLGHYGRKTVFVPFTLPGERVQVRPLREEDGYMLAEGVRLIEASADRVYPACGAFGIRGCARCSWQHINEAAQRLLKQDIAADLLERIGGVRDPKVLPTLPVAAQSWGYLWHVLYTPHAGRLALPAHDGRDAVQVDECALIHPDVTDLYAALDLDLTDITRVRLLRGEDDQRMIVLHLAAEQAPELEADLPASINVILPDNEPMNLIGDSHMRYTVDGHTLRVTAGSFFRPNVPAVGILMDVVRQAAALTGREAVLDLYAGVGVFSAALAAEARRITLVESYPPAVTDADDNLAAFDHIDVIEGGVEAVIESLLDAVADAADDGDDDSPSYAVAVVDPSGGLSPAVIDGLARLGVVRLVYVCEDPMVLAKECKRLAKAGYRLAYAQPVDSAPHTPHFDVVAVFMRS